MTTPIKIFVCHKKILIRQKDGHEVEYENAKAAILHAILQTCQDRYDAWIDDSEIGAGMAWETEIYSRLLVSDVLLIAIGPGTLRSEWVRREIALATALGVSIVPIGFDLTPDEFKQELKAMQIDHIQGRLTQNIKFPAKNALLQEIHSDLQRAREKTVREQERVLTMLTKRRTITAPKAPDKQRAFSVEVPIGPSRVRLNIASGDLTKTIGIDVLVNSENDYMQMARFFESRTVSSLLRRKGARIAGGKYVDTIQQELDTQLGDRGRPVQAAEVFITSAGGPDSHLTTENKTRYIFHVAAVQAIDAEAKIVPFRQPYQIEDCVRSCLVKLAELNWSKGVVSPPGTPQRLLQEQLAKDGKGVSKSILFPLFGTGQGGASCAEVIKPMLSVLRRFFEDPDHSDLANVLDDIYFAAFTTLDVVAITDELSDAFSWKSAE
jgi:O-acetyl-ADP-ribose deacetylase (regulator of RNase III)